MVFAGTAGGPQDEVPEKRALKEHLFTPSTQCMACHNQLTAKNGEDFSTGTTWRAAMMSNSAADPYWQAGVRRETLEHPKAAGAIEDVCSSCHMPMARYITHQAGMKGAVFSNLAQGNTMHGPPLAHLAGEGISCSVCHQIQPDNLGKKESYGAGFLVDTVQPAGNRRVYGPFAISSGNTRVMRSASGFSPEKAEHIRESALCGSCHTLYTHALDNDGNAVAELPEQMPYIEWLHSDYAEVKSCQDCHMEQVHGDVAVSSVMGVSRQEVKEHSFIGGNFFMLRMLSKHSTEMGLAALPAELNAAADASTALLVDSTAEIKVDTAKIAVANDTVSFPVVIENLAGHKLPTAYPSRRVWIHLSVSQHHGDILLESGKLNPDGSIAGNDNDEDPLRFETHYEVISSESQVQVYESIMAAPDGSVTTGLLNGASYLKDNRIPPLGFAKANVSDDVAVRGRAADDGDLGDGKDRIVYRVGLPEGTDGTKLTVTAELWYQSIGFRWANNLDKFDAFEPRRFIRMYRDFDGMESARMLASARYSISLDTPEPQE